MMDSSSSSPNPETDVDSWLFFTETLKREIALAERSQRGFGVLVVEVGGGESAAAANSSNGFLTILRQLVRTGDLVARYGGTRFAILLSDTLPLDAIRCALRILDRIEEMRGSSVTVSIGVLHYPAERKSLRPEQVLTEAERATVRAKRQGGNCFMVAEFQ